MSTEAGVHVVLGGSGSVGNAVVRLLMERPAVLRAVNRSGSIPFLRSRVPVVAAEAIRRTMEWHRRRQSEARASALRAR